MTTPTRDRTRPSALVALATLGLALAAGGVAAARTVLPRGVDVAVGVHVAGVALAPGEDVEEIAAGAADSLLDRTIRLTDGAGRELLVVTARELGATADIEAAVRDARSIGRTGDLAHRLADVWRVRATGAHVPLRVHLPADVLARWLETAKEDLDAAARAARLDVETTRVTPHVEGRWLDAFATAERVERAILGGTADEVAVVFRAVVPAASTEAATRADVRTELARFETRFGGPVGRDRNIARAATALDGLVLMPGAEVSFNAEVGPRSTDNGFFPAPEIYRGEMREGIGGGSCQVASTVYAAALFAGLEVTERRNHSRPSGYIRPGLDATVSYPVLDLRVRNGFDFPVVLDTRIESGVLHARILGSERRVDVELATETAGVSKFKRKVERAGWLGDSGSKLKQRGKNGVSIRRTLRLRERGGAERVVTSMDVYPPTQEIWLLAPGADPDAVLPPFGEAAGAALEDGSARGAVAPSEAAPGPV